MSNQVTVTRGQTFRIRRALRVGLKGSQFSAEVRAMGSNRKVGDLTIRELDVDEVCLLELEAPTEGWPLTILSTDIKALMGDEVAYSETLQINVVRNVTV